VRLEKTKEEEYIVIPTYVKYLLAFGLHYSMQFITTGEVFSKTA
jgi:hypothetical protein